MSSVYLSGPLANCNEIEAKGWRVEARRLLDPIRVADPLERWYRGGYEGLTEREKLQIVDRDLEQIGASDVVLACCWKCGWGTAQEVLYAHWWRIPVVVVAPTMDVSPWLVAHSTVVFTDLRAGCEWIRERFGVGSG